MLCDFYSLEGLSHLLKTVEIVEKKLYPEIKINVLMREDLKNLGIIPPRIDFFLLTLTIFNIYIVT
jgi:hypothetical protein